MIYLENWAYMVLMGFGMDQWRLSGTVYGHPNRGNGEFIHVSTPKAFDKEKMTVLTCSGKTYKLGKCAGNLEKEIKNILEDIKNNGTECW